MARLALALLGDYRAMLDEKPIAGFESVKVRALLAYLAVEAQHPHRREALAALLWPEQPESDARANLSQALFNLRSILGDRPRRPSLLSVTRETIGLNGACDSWTDVTSFISLLQSCEKHPHAQIETCEACLPRLQEAAALYRGSLLQDLAVHDSVPFEEWVLLQREYLHRLAIEALGWLALGHERRGDYALGLQCARRQIELDPWREEAQRQVMRLLVLSGQRSVALAQYEACRRALAEELGVEPVAETVALYEQIRRGALAQSPHIIMGPIHELALPASEDIPEPPHPLFVARERELAQLDDWLRQALAGRGRVGFVVGEPGSGKTVLMQEFARRAMQAYPDLIVAGGACNAYVGIGDPYLPFVEMLRLLIGDAEARLAAGALSHEHARRLQGIAPTALQAVLEVGPAMIDVLLTGAALLRCAQAPPAGAQWVSRVQQALDHRVVAPSQAFLFDQATRVLQVLAQGYPLLLILDDLQWSDPASISLLFHLGRRLGSPGLPGPRILVLGAYRPEEVAAGREGQPHPLQPVMREFQGTWGQVQVDLAQVQGEAFVEAFLDSEPNRLGAAFREALYRHTGGHALFTAELLRGLQERGDLCRDAAGRWMEGATLDWERLPERLEATIAERIERLPREEQELVSVASVEGEEFHAEVAARVLQRSEGEVIESLSGPLGQEHRLVIAHSLRHIGEQRLSRYRFRHYLFQSYLYQRLDPVRRAHLHGEVGNALQALGAAPPSVPSYLDTIKDQADDAASLLRVDWIVSEGALAWHWEQAAQAEKAVCYHITAARKASLSSFTYDELFAHGAKGPALLALLPESPRRTRLELLCYQILGWAWAMMKSWMAPEAGQAWQKCLELAELLGDALLLADALTWMSRYHRVRGELDRAISLHERAVSLAEGAPPLWLPWMRGELALTLLYHGDLARAARLLAPLSEALFRTGSIPLWGGTTIRQLATVPWALWCLGYPEQALEVGQATLQMVANKKSGVPVGSDAQALCSAICFTHRLRGEVEQVEQALQRLRPLVEEQRCSPTLLPMITMCQGWVHTYSGRMGEFGELALRQLRTQGIAELRQALADWSLVSVLMQPYYKGQLGEALARAGRTEEAVALLEEALEQVERTGERWNEAELWRLKGELLGETRGRGDPSLCSGQAGETRGKGEAEACFRRGIEVARRQEARSWELRAATSLARLLREQGRGAEARQMLSAIYNWFTEGLDTPDLAEAKALLEELAAC